MVISNVYNVFINNIYTVSKYVVNCGTMKKVKYIECDICGKKVKAQGIGGHKALVHGVIDRVVVFDTSKDTSTRVKQPAAYTKKNERVIETRVEAIKKPTLYKQRPDLVGMPIDSYGRITCPGCGIKEQPGSLHTGGYCHFCHNGLPNPHVQNRINWENGIR